MDIVTDHPNGGVERGHCALCGESVPLVELADHFRLLHPDIDFTIETWPNGDPVIVDTTLTPDVFGEGKVGCSCGGLSLNVIEATHGTISMQCPTCHEWVESAPPRKGDRDVA